MTYKFKIEVKVWKTGQVGQRTYAAGDTHEVDKLDRTKSLEEFFMAEATKINKDLNEVYETIFGDSYNDPLQKSLGDFDATD